MNYQILIDCGGNYFAFTKSATGQLDFAGKVKDKIDVKGWQKITSSSYYTPAKYLYLSDEMNMTPYVYLAEGVDVSDCDVYDFLLHIGALLAAVDSKNSFLAGELYLRRKESFEKFAQLSQFIMKDLCVEILFSLCYGRMQELEPEEIPLVYNSAIEKLDYDPAKESLDQAIMAYFKKNNTRLTLPLVGTQFYRWDMAPESLEHLCDNLKAEDLISQAEKIRKAKHDFYASLEISAQAEPYNKYDENSILVCIEDIEAKLCGNPGLVKVGHLRALAAQILRKAKAKKMAYRSELVAISFNQIVVSLEF